MVRSSGTNASFLFPADRIDIPDGTQILCYQSSAPTGYVKETSVNDYALRVVSGSGGGTVQTIRIEQMPLKIIAADIPASLDPKKDKKPPTV